MQNLVLIASLSFLACVASAPANPKPAPTALGQFSVSLAVKDLKASRAFYEALGFAAIEHYAKLPKYGETWLMLRHGDAVLGLFQGLFDKNSLTFNPLDVRAVQAAAKQRGLHFEKEAEGTSGPAAAFLFDPDGNPVLLDQH